MKLKSDKGWVVIPVHYSQDPFKGPEWVAEMRKAYLSDEAWMREMELDFSQTTGVRAYPKFRRELHVVKSSDMPYNPTLPLCLCCDFNVGIMCWPVIQIVKDKIYIIDEIVLEPASVPDMVREFRNKYPAHPAELWIYGDATGNAREAQSLLSEYDVMRTALRGYTSPVVMNVPTKNPPVADRINSLNNMLIDADGGVRLFVSDKCEYMIQDFFETLRDNRGIKKCNRAEDPYSKRSHGTDAVGYLAARKFPTVQSVINSDFTKPRKQPKYNNYFGKFRERSRRRI